MVPPGTHVHAHRINFLENEHENINEWTYIKELNHFLLNGITNHDKVKLVHKVGLFFR